METKFNLDLINSRLTQAISAEDLVQRIQNRTLNIDCVGEGFGEVNLGNDVVEPLYVLNEVNLEFKSLETKNKLPLAMNFYVVDQTISDGTVDTILITDDHEYAVDICKDVRYNVHVKEVK